MNNLTHNWKKKGIHGVMKMILLEIREGTRLEEVLFPSGFMESMG